MPISYTDAVYPDDGIVQSDYIISVSPGISTDTVTIVRNILNNNIMGVDSAALLINFPTASQLLEFGLVGESDAVRIQCMGPLENYILTNSYSYIWTIVPAGDSHGSIAGPEESLEIACKFLVPRAGGLELAPQAAIIYFPEQTNYTVSDSILINTRGEEEYPGSPDENNQPGRFTVLASPNPFNSSVRVRFSGEDLKGRKLDFRVFDILGRMVYTSRAVVEFEEGEIIWSPNAEIATGVYFYRIVIDNNHVDGKMILLK